MVVLAGVCSAGAAYVPQWCYMLVCCETNFATLILTFATLILTFGCDPFNFVTQCAGLRASVHGVGGPCGWDPRPLWLFLLLGAVVLN